MESIWQSAHDSPIGHDTVAGSIRSAPTPDVATADPADDVGQPPRRAVDGVLRLVAGGDLSMWVDRRVRSSAGDSLGITVGVYAHTVSQQPAWLIVDTEMLGTPVVVAPARGSSLLGDDIVVAADRDALLTAPTVNGLRVMDPADERSLTGHYARRASEVAHPSRRCIS
jgi:hypothetical protein